MRSGKTDAGLFFTASPLKLVLLSVFTFGYYEFYWFYRNWLLYKARSEKRVRPLWRATFAPLWAYSLFKKIEGEAVSHGFPVTPGAAILAGAYVLLFIVHLLPDPVNAVSVLTVIPIFLANRMASSVNVAVVPGYKENARFGILNITTLFFGIILVGLSVAAKFYDGPSLLEMSQESGFSFGAKMQSRLGR